MRRRPTGVAAAVAACGVLLIGLSGPAQAMWLAVMGALVLGTVVASTLVRHRLDTATVAVGSAASAVVGDPVDVQLTVAASRRPLPVHRLELVGPPFGDVAVVVEPVRPGSPARLTARLTARHRGLFTVQPARLRTGAPFGLLRSDAVLDASCRLEVAAAVVALPPYVVRALVGVTDESAQRRRGSGDEVHAVREFRSGDALRDVHWRSTARSGRLVVREYERSVPSRTVVAAVGGEPGEPFEALVSAAASVAHAVWRAAEPVDVVRSDDTGVHVVRGASQHGVRSWSAAVSAGACDVAGVADVALADGVPSAVVLAVGAGATRLPEACGRLIACGAAVTVIVTQRSMLAGLPDPVRGHVLEPGSDVAAVLGGAG